jgi:hypothetical protein
MENGPWVLIVLLSRNPEKGRPPISAQAKCNRGHNKPGGNWFAQKRRFRAYQFPSDSNGVLARKLNIGQLLSLEVMNDLVIGKVEKIMRQCSCSLATNRA